MNREPSGSETADTDISSLAEQIDAEDKRDKRRADASGREEAEEAAAKHRRQRRVLTVLVAVLVVLSVVNLAGLNPFVTPIPPPTEAQLRLSVLNDLEIMVDEVEDWRAEWGTVPTTLDELTDASEGWSYRPTETGYQIALTVDDVTVSYDSSQDADEFFSPLYETREE